jgi:hypothetical protein
MIALLWFMLAIANAEMYSNLSMALTTISETATFDAHVSQFALSVEKEMDGLSCCMRNSTCRDALEPLRVSLLLMGDGDVKSINSKINTLLDSACINDPVFEESVSRMRNFVSLAKDAKARISRLQGDFAFAVYEAGFLGGGIVFDINRYNELWNLDSCFECVEQTEEEEELYNIFKERMAQIENAIYFAMINANSSQEKELEDFAHSMLHYLTYNRFKLHRMTKRTESSINTPMTGYAAFALVVVISFFLATRFA